MVDFSRKVATSVSYSEQGALLQYHNTIVVHYDCDNIWLNTGGWSTVTTKRRMNEASHAFRLGYHVYQKRFEWFAEYCNRDGALVTVPFDGSTCTLNRADIKPARGMHPSVVRGERV